VRLAIAVLLASDFFSRGPLGFQSDLVGFVFRNPAGMRAEQSQRMCHEEEPLAREVESRNPHFASWDDPWELWLRAVQRKLFGLMRRLADAEGVHSADANFVQGDDVFFVNAKLAQGLHGGDPPE